MPQATRGARSSAQARRPGIQPSDEAQAASPRRPERAAALPPVAVVCRARRARPPAAVRPADSFGTVLTQRWPHAGHVIGLRRSSGRSSWGAVLWNETASRLARTLSAQAPATRQRLLPSRIAPCSCAPLSDAPCSCAKSSHAPWSQTRSSRALRRIAPVRCALQWSAAVNTAPRSGRPRSTSVRATASGTPDTPAVACIASASRCFSLISVSFGGKERAGEQACGPPRHSVGLAVEQRAAKRERPPLRVEASPRLPALFFPQRPAIRFGNRNDSALARAAGLDW